MMDEHLPFHMKFCIEIQHFCLLLDILQRSSSLPPMLSPSIGIKSNKRLIRLTYEHSKTYWTYENAGQLPRFREFGNQELIIV
jgi:hypothetical protein